MARYKLQSKRQDLADAPELVKSAALSYLSRREYTAAELHGKLAARGAAVETIEQTLAYLQEANYQSDERAGRAWINGRLRFAPRGRFLLCKELQERGLASDLVEILLEELYPPEAEQAALQRFITAQRITPTEDYAENQKRYLKLARRAASKGFKNGDIIAALEVWRGGVDIK